MRHLIRLSYLLGAAILVALAGCDMDTPPPSPPVLGGTPTPTGSVAQSPATRPPDLPAMCRASDLRGVAGWQGAGGTLVGAISVTNAGSTSCTLDGRPGVHLTRPGGAMLPVTDIEPTDDPSSCCAPLHGSPVVLKPGDRAFARFAWRNYCGSEQGPFMLAVALPGEGGQLSVPLLDTAGNALADTPRCDAADLASTLTAGAFVSAP